MLSARCLPSFARWRGRCRGVVTCSRAVHRGLSSTRLRTLVTSHIIQFTRSPHVFHHMRSSLFRDSSSSVIPVNMRFVLYAHQMVLLHVVDIDISTSFHSRRQRSLIPLVDGDLRRFLHVYYTILVSKEVRIKPMPLRVYHHTLAK